MRRTMDVQDGNAYDPGSREGVRKRFSFHKNRPSLSECVLIVRHSLFLYQPVYWTVVPFGTAQHIQRIHLQYHTGRFRVQKGVKALIRRTLFPAIPSLQQAAAWMQQTGSESSWHNRFGLRTRMAKLPLPSFGRRGIKRFWSSVSSRKWMPAR